MMKYSIDLWPRDALEVSLSNSRRHFSTERRFRKEVPPRSYRWLEAAESSSKYSVGDIITRCERDAGKVPENRGEAITRDGKTAESFRFDESSLLTVDAVPPEPPDITWTANLKLRFAGHFRVPGGWRWCWQSSDLRCPKCGLTAITVSAGYFRWWRTQLVNF